MRHTTGLTSAQVATLFDWVQQACRETESGKVAYPPILGLYKSFVMCLTYLRTNRTEAEMAEEARVSQPTVSRAITALTPIVARVLTHLVPQAEDVDLRSTVVVDGSLLPCWSWRAHPRLYSGKHKTTGMNVQVACDLDGRLLWVSDPVDGCSHDMEALRQSGFLDGSDPSLHIADRGYQGSAMITPTKSSKHHPLSDNTKACNTAINKLRYVIERTIAHLKNWKILHTDYRRPIETFAQTITAVVGLYFYTHSE